MPSKVSTPSLVVFIASRLTAKTILKDKPLTPTKSLFP